jgi:hypothetical protein
MIDELLRLTRHAPAKTNFVVADGFHAGVSLVLDGAEHRIGSAPAADIVLADPGVEPEHAVLRQIGGRVRIEATGGDVLLAAGVLAKGHGCRVALPAELRIGGARVRLEPTASGAGGWAARLAAVRWPAAAAAGAAACISAVAVIAALSPQPAASLAPGAPPSNADLEAVGPRLAYAGRLDELGPLGTLAAPPSRRIAARSQDGRAPTLEEPAERLRARIAAAGLGNLAVAVADGRLVVSGILDPARAPAWKEVRRWFDERYGERIVLSVELRDPKAAPMASLSLKAIWLGEHPYVISADGGRYYEGALLNDGWTIKEIGTERLELARDGEVYSLAY